MFIQITLSIMIEFKKFTKYLHKNANQGCHWVIIYKVNNNNTKYKTFPKHNESDLMWTSMTSKVILHLMMLAFIDSFFLNQFIYECARGNLAEIPE